MKQRSRFWEVIEIITFAVCVGFITTAPAWAICSVIVIILTIENAKTAIWNKIEADRDTKEQNWSYLLKLVEGKNE